jgi:hypothetical protein
MMHRFDLHLDRVVTDSSAIVLKTINLLVEDAARMLVIQDLSGARPAMFQTCIKYGCPEGGTDV